MSERDGGSNEGGGRGGGLRGVRGEKEALRASMRERLSRLDGESRERGSEAVCRRLAALPAFAAAETVLVYLAMRGWREEGRVAEVCCDGLIDACWASGKRVCGPRIDWASRLMTPAELRAGDEVEVRYYDVPEPRGEAAAVGLEEIGLVLTPGLAFDRERRRLGRGAGFYDRFLVEYDAARGAGKDDAGRSGVVVGLAFDGQVVQRAPAEAHDRLVDVLVTETETIGG